jgi:hypothetical protein
MLCALSLPCPPRAPPNPQIRLPKWTLVSVWTSFVEVQLAVGFIHFFVTFWYLVGLYTRVPIPVTARSKAWVCGLSLAGIVGSNPAGNMDVCVVWVFVLSGTGLCVGLINRPEESYRVWCVWVWSWSLDEEALAHCGLLRYWKKYIHGF